MSKDIVVIFCPPLRDYKEQPNDQSKCELVDCPQCNEKMWMSEKKNSLLILSRAFEKEILLCCYKCFVEYVTKNPDCIKNFTKIEL